jgi:hypothetical protein
LNTKLISVFIVLLALLLKSLHQDAVAEAALSKAEELGYKAPSTK